MRSRLTPARRIFRLFAPPLRMELTRPRGSCLEKPRERSLPRLVGGKIYAGRDFMTLAAAPARRRAYPFRFLSPRGRNRARAMSPLMLDPPILYRLDRRYEPYRGIACMMRTRLAPFTRLQPSSEILATS